MKPNPPHDSINDLLGLNICFCFGCCSIFQFLLEGIFGSLAGVSLTGQFAGSLETVVSTGFGSLKFQIKFTISSQRAQKMFKRCSSQVQIKLKYRVSHRYVKVVIMLKAMAFLNLSTKNSNHGRESVRRSQNVS